MYYISYLICIHIVFLLIYWWYSLFNECSTANPTRGDIFESSFQAQSSKLEWLFSLKCNKRDVRALSFELSKMTPQVGLAVYILYDMTIFTFQWMYYTSYLICIHIVYLLIFWWYPFLNECSIYLIWYVVYLLHIIYLHHRW